MFSPKPWVLLALAFIGQFLPLSGWAQDIGDSRSPEASAVTWAPASVSTVTAFVNVNVVPMDRERLLSDQTVLVEGEQIIALGPADKVKVPAGALRIDGKGKYLLPGLSDMHVHLSGLGAQVERSLFSFLAYGVTTVRNMDYLAQSSGADVLQWRDQVAAGRLLGPRIYTSGFWGSLDTQGRRLPVKAADVAAQIAAYKRAGYDFVKLSAMEFLDMKDPRQHAMFDALVAAAARERLPIAGHVPTNGALGLPFALASMRSIEHLTGFWVADSAGIWQSLDTTALAAKVAAIKRAKVWNCPTAALYTGLLPDNSSMARDIRHVLKALQDADAGLLIGTDFPVTGNVPGSQVHAELREWVRAGLTPFQALRAGTRNAAAYFDMLGKTGTVASGKRADLVLLSGNPLEDLKYALRPAGVMVGGFWLSRAELDRRLGGSRGASESMEEVP